jgi:hypothetical protein
MFILQPQSRSCQGCTRCCEGWLSGRAHGHEFGPGRPCGWLGKTGCVIYSSRPQDPCRSFECEWKINSLIPPELNPKHSKVIMLSKWVDQYRYIRMIECGQGIPSWVWEWAQKWHQETGTNFVAWSGTQPQIIGSQEFSEAFTSWLNQPR